MFYGKMASRISYIFQDLDRSDGLESQRFRPKSCFSGVRFHSSALGRHFRRSMAMGLPYSGWAVWKGVVRVFCGEQFGAYKWRFRFIQFPKHP